MKTSNATSTTASLGKDRVRMFEELLSKICPEFSDMPKNNNPKPSVGRGV